MGYGYRMCLSQWSVYSLDIHAWCRVGTGFALDALRMVRMQSIRAEDDGMGEDCAMSSE